MSVIFYTSVDFLQLIPFYLCAKCGRLVKINEICECESIFTDIQGKKNDDDDNAVERSGKPELATSREEESHEPDEAKAICQNAHN